MRFIKAFFAVLGLVLAMTGPVAAQPVSSEPILRIETGMHTARTLRVDSDAAGRRLITASIDGTARIWDATTGEGIATLRLPRGAGRAGDAYAAALSPDGTRAAVAGWTRYDGEAISLFVFDTATGEMLHRLPVMGNVVHEMAFSPDGRLLALGGHGTSGVVVLDTGDWSVAARLTGIGGTVHGLGWDEAGWLAVASWDGFLALYAPDLSLSARTALGPDARPQSLSFRPGAKELALGFSGEARLEIRDSRSLAWLEDQEVDAPVIAVGWSSDGERLLAGGNARGQTDAGQWRNVVYTFDQDSWVWRVDHPLLGDVILDIHALPGGDMVVLSSAQELVRLGPGGEERWRHDSSLPSWRTADKSHFRLAPGGRGVGMTPVGGQALHFDPVAGRLLEGRAPETWAEPTTGWSGATGGMVFTDWSGSMTPLLNDRPVAGLDPFERSLSVSVGVGGDFAVLGGDWHILGLEADGSQRWRIPLPGAAFAVNLADDGRTLVAALGDGTVRWYRAADGAELLALFVHADRSRWVAWTPSGHYDAAPGGEEMIGWLVNRGVDQVPDFFPANVFRDRFYRPDVVALVLDVLDERAAVAQADAARARPAPTPAPLAEVLPPVLRIRAPERDAPVTGDLVRLELDISTPDDAPLTEVSARVNGRLVPEARKEGSAITLPLPAIADTELFVSLQPANRHGFGPTVDLRLRRDEPAAAAPSARVRPKLYVLAIGVSEYEDASLRLNYAAKDAEDIAALFAAQTGPLYREVEVRLLTDAKASFMGVRAGLGWLRREMTDIDTALIFVAGHGVNDNNGDLFFLTHETELDAIYETAVEATMFTDTIQRLPGRVIYMMDTCHSGNLDFVRRGAARVDLNRHLQDLRAATGAVVFSSAMGSQYALESPLWGNGAFTLAVLEGLAGQADIDGDGTVTVSELHAWISNRVKALTDGAQTPVLRLPDEVRDFPVAMAALAAQARP